MNREKRYDKKLSVLGQLEGKVAAERLSDKKQTMTTVVVEQELPEYERTWQFIEDRVEREHSLSALGVPNRERNL